MAVFLHSGRLKKLRSCLGKVERYAIPEIGIGIEIGIRLRPRFRFGPMGVPDWLGTDHSSMRFAPSGRAILLKIPRAHCILRPLPGRPDLLPSVSGPLISIESFGF